MYFKKLAEQLGEVPDYVVENLLGTVDEVTAGSKVSPRKIFGEKTKILAFRDSSTSLKALIEFLQDYISSQHYECLKNKIPYERSSCLSGDPTDQTNLPNRYINRIGEMIVVPIRGSCKISSEEFDNVEEFKVGEIWRYNSRIPMNYEYTRDFYCIVIGYVDFDLSHYLMPFDVHGMFPRRKDEFLDSTEADFKIKDDVSTNAY